VAILHVRALTALCQVLKLETKRGKLKKSIYLFFAVSVLGFNGVFFVYTPWCEADTLNARPPVLPLHVEGKKIKDADNRTILFRSVNFDHYMEYAYNTEKVTIEEFHKRLRWYHTREDYFRIKNWGLNCVRLNISPKHVYKNGTVDQTAFDNLKDQVKWAKEAGLYMIIAYFAPPGSVEDQGYYSEKEFYQDIRNQDGSLNYSGENEYLKQYLEHWRTIANVFKDEPHLLYELLNEPQLLHWEDYGDDESTRIKNYLSLLPHTNDETLYVNLMKACINTIRNTGDKHVIVIDGLSYASAVPQNFRFIHDLKDFDNNLIYSFHYYHPRDFVWQGCNWKNEDCTLFHDVTDRLLTSHPGWVQVELPFSMSDFDAEYTSNTPILQINSVNQAGAYYFKKVEIVDEEGTLLMSENFSNKHAESSVNDPDAAEGFLTDLSNECRSWTTLSNNQWGSAEQSEISVFDASGEKVIGISSTVNKNEDKYGYGYVSPDGTPHRELLKEGNWAGQYFYKDGPDCTFPIVLNEDQTYRLILIVKGQNLTNMGTTEVLFMRPHDHKVMWKKRIARYPNSGDSNTIDRKLSSDIEMIGADFAQMKQIVDRHNVPLFLGEFGVPMRNLYLDDSLAYFRQIAGISENQGFGWSLHAYRAPHGTGPCEDYPCADYRTFALYSGEGKSVSDMEAAGLGTDMENSLYFYRPHLIEEIKNTIAALQPIYVKGDGLCGSYSPCYATVQDAINAATTGAAIRIAQGTYTASITLNALKSLTLKGGWNSAFTSQTPNTTIIKAPKAPKGSLTLQVLTIRP